MVLRAFDLGVTHFDLANNYGPPHGAAEETLGWILGTDLRPYRDELVISTRQGAPPLEIPMLTGRKRVRTAGLLRWNCLHPILEGPP